MSSHLAMLSLPRYPQVSASVWRQLYVAGYMAGQNYKPEIKANDFSLLISSMAEEVGFEPTVRFPARRFSRPVP